MKVAIDKDIPFSDIYIPLPGDIVKVDGRTVTAKDLADVDVLIIRSITRVNEALLDGSGVRFVGTVTSGSNHVDKQYLARRGIGFTDARGCNARAVAEYVLSSVLVLLEQRKDSAMGKVAGIVGCGYVGRLVSEFFQALGMTCLHYDPPLQENTGADCYAAFDDILGAEIITLHVPLESTGRFPTLGMFSRPQFEQLREDVILINTSRGEVMDEKNLLEFMNRNPQTSCVLDVWCHEPEINTALLDSVSLGTAHIAGYSLDAKYRALQAVYTEACTYLGQEPVVPPEPAVFQQTSVSLPLVDTGEDLELIRMAVLRSYDVRTDSGALHALLDQPAADQAGYFDELRNNYRSRREFSALRVESPPGRPGLKASLKKLGFNLN